jgi:hypothetical protein
MASKNNRVLQICYKIVRDLGDLEDRVEEFVDS